MNVGVPILDAFNAPPGSPFSRPSSPSSDGSSPPRHREGRASPPPLKEPLFRAPAGRGMVDELTEKRRLAREAAFELLLARSPKQAAALDARHTHSVFDGSARPVRRQSPRKKFREKGAFSPRHRCEEPSSHRSATERAEDDDARRAARSSHYMPVPARPPPPPSSLPAPASAARPIAVRAAKVAPAGIWASNNAHLPLGMLPGCDYGALDTSRLSSVHVSPTGRPLSSTFLSEKPRRPDLPMDAPRPLPKTRPQPLIASASIDVDASAAGIAPHKPPPPKTVPSTAPMLPALSSSSKASTAVPPVVSAKPTLAPAATKGFRGGSSSRSSSGLDGAVADAPPAKATAAKAAKAAAAAASSAVRSATDGVAVHAPAALRPPPPRSPPRTIWGMPVDALGMPIDPEQYLGEDDLLDDTPRDHDSPKMYMVVEEAKEHAAQEQAHMDAFAAARNWEPAGFGGWAGHACSGRWRPPTPGRAPREDAGDWVGAAYEYETLITARIARSVSTDESANEECMHASDGELVEAHPRAKSLFHPKGPGAVLSAEATGQPDAREPGQQKHVMVQVFSGSRAPLLLRHPGSLPLLRRRLARLLVLREPSIRISTEIPPRESRQPPRADQPRMMRVRVSGVPVVGGVQLLMVLASWLNLIAAGLFCYFTLWKSVAPSPFIYGAPLPLLSLLLHAHSAYSALSAEFHLNEPLREVLGRKAGEATQLALMAPMGPDTVLLLGGLALHARGVPLAAQCDAALGYAAALITPLTLDLPLLALNLLYHRRTGIPYDVPSLLLLGMAAFSLGVQQPWRLLRLFRQWRRQQAARRKADAAASPAVGEGESTDWDELSLQEIQAAQRQAGVEGGFKLSPSKERQRSNAAAQATMKALEAKMRAASPEPYADEERGSPNAYNA